MTPKEKALELIEKFNKYSNGTKSEVVWGDVEREYSPQLKEHNSKQCAIICVQQIIKEMGDCLDVTGSSYVKQEVWHWNLVLDFLNKS